MASEASKIDRRFTLKEVVSVSILYAMSLAWMGYGPPFSLLGLLILVATAGGTIAFLAGGRAAIVDGIHFAFLLMFLVLLLLPVVR